MQLYEGVGGVMGARLFSWMKLSEEWRWGRAHSGFCSDVISKELCLRAAREGGRSATHMHTHTARGSTYTHANTSESANEPLSGKQMRRPGGVGIS